MKRFEALGDAERRVIEERRRTGYRTARLTRFGGSLEPELRALLARLLPGVDGGIDLAAFVDANADHTVGRGDRAPGLPSRGELIRRGLDSLARSGFAALPVPEQDALVGRMRHGLADDELGLPAREFVDRLLVTALAGYLAHPATWERIGFNGPAYPEGYAWISGASAGRRHDGFVGADRL